MRFHRIIIAAGVLVSAASAFAELEAIRQCRTEKAEYHARILAADMAMLDLERQLSAAGSASTGQLNAIAAARSSISRLLQPDTAKLGAAPGRCVDPLAVAAIPPIL